MTKQQREDEIVRFDYELRNTCIQHAIQMLMGHTAVAEESQVLQKAEALYNFIKNVGNEN